MIQLTYAQYNLEVTEITEKLSSLSLAYKKVHKETDSITLTEGDDTVLGKRDILDYINKLSGELDQWYYCNC